MSGDEVLYVDPQHPMAIFRQSHALWLLRKSYKSLIPLAEWERERDAQVIRRLIEKYEKEQQHYTSKGMKASAERCELVIVTLEEELRAAIGDDDE